MRVLSDLKNASNVLDPFLVVIASFNVIFIFAIIKTKIFIKTKIYINSNQVTKLFFISI